MKAFKADFLYENQIEILDLVLYLYSKTTLKTEITNRERHVLREYILNGYSAETKKIIMLNMNIKPINLNVINSKLQQKGFLHPHPRKHTLKVLDKQLLDIRDCFVSDDPKKLFIVDFAKK